ncbi:MAG: hypothetical protein ACE15E_23360 [Acidobacteriota bacterium]
MLLTVAGILVGVIVLGFVGLIIRAMTLERRHASRVSERINKVVDQLMSGSESAQSELMPLAGNPETRNMLFARLESLGKADLFPSTYRTREAFAESDMVFWLSHPNELGCPPAEIELAAKIRKDLPGKDDALEFFVFRFRASASHWAASSGWMAGITGPYAAHCDSPLESPCTFSELEPFDSKTPADHVDYLVSKMGSIALTR